MKYQRLKSIDGSGTIMRYYKFTGDEAYANAFYGVTDGVAEKIEGTVGDGVQIIGFSHGGNNLAKGLLFLDINPAIVYAAFLGEGEDRPDIGDVVNGYQKVIDTHYDGDDGVYGKNDDLFGVERLDAPYYLFTIVQPEGTEYASEVDDDDAGEISGLDPNEKKRPEPVEVEYTITVSNKSGYSASLVATPEVGDAETETLADDGTYDCLQKVGAGKTLSTVYTSIVGTVEGLEWSADGTTVINSDATFIVPSVWVVSFNSNGGSDVASEKVWNESKVTEPADPTKASYTFAGWYKEDTLTTEFDFTTDKITADTTLYAKWTD